MILPITLIREQHRYGKAKRQQEHGPGWSLAAALLLNATGSTLKSSYGVFFNNGKGYIDNWELYEVTGLH